MQVGEDPGHEMGRGTEKAFTARGRGGGEGGGNRAGAAHHMVAGRALVEGEALAAGRGEGISQAGGAGGVQQWGHPSFVGLSGKKLMPNEHDPRLPLC